MGSELNRGVVVTGLSCSFCRLAQNQVRRLIAGPNVYICVDCVDLCSDIAEESAERAGTSTATPEERELRAAKARASRLDAQATSLGVRCRDLEDLLREWRESRRTPRTAASWTAWLNDFDGRVRKALVVAPEGGPLDG